MTQTLFLYDGHSWDHVFDWSLGGFYSTKRSAADDSAWTSLLLVYSSFPPFDKEELEQQGGFISAASLFQSTNWAITFTFELLPLTLKNLQSQRKLKSLQKFLSIADAFEDEWAAKIIINGFISDGDDSLMYSRQSSLRSSRTCSVSWLCSDP